MKIFGNTLALATVALSLPLLVSAQNTQTPQDPGAAPSAAVDATASREAASMVPVNAVLSRALDARKDQPGSVVQVRLIEKARLSDGTELPSGSILMGKVVQDEMQQQGMSTLSLRFDQARLKDGKVVPIRAMIVGILGPIGEAGFGEGYVSPNDWTDATLQVDQEDVRPGVDLHSGIASQNSGELVSTKKDDVKLSRGSQVQFAVGPGATQDNAAGGQ